MPKILIAASGTGGHIFPALAVADSLPESWEVFWLGVPDRLETRIVPISYQLQTVQVGGLQGNIGLKIIQLFKLLIATKFVISFIKRKDIQVVFTTGGYIAAPAILAAKFCGIKSILHESNAFPGKVTRLLGPFCEVVALGWPVVENYLNQCKTVVTGTPVRKSFYQQQPLPEWVPHGLGSLVVVIGGSQGAIGLNRLARTSFQSLLDMGCRVVHLTGNNDKNYSGINDQNVIEKPFTNEIPGLFQHADLVISRAGAGIINELAICGTPAVLIPYPFASDNHQEFNASYAAQNGAAVIVHQQNKNQFTLITVIDRLLRNRRSSSIKDDDLLALMQKGMKGIFIRDSEKKLIELIINSL